MDIEEVYKIYFNDVYLFVLSLSKNEDTAKDITADTFMTCMLKLDSLEDESKVRIWLCQIAKNKYFNLLKRSKKFDEIAKLEHDFNIVSSKNHIANLLEDKELCGRIHILLHQMKEPYKEVFTLRTFGELSFKQIGELFGKSENWACVTYHRAKEKIQAQL